MNPMSDDELKAMFSELRSELTQTADRVVAENRHFFRIEAESLRHETQLVAEGVTGAREALTRETTDIRESLRGEIQIVAESVTATRESLTRETAGIREEIGSLRSEIQIVAESVTATRQTLTRETADIREEVQRTASETQAMIKFSHAELDRRMNRLEEALADLQVRVERLEGSTH